MNSQNLKASVSFVGDGTTNKFYFGFDYINKQFVKVQIGNEGQSLTYPSDYTVDDRSVVLKDTPAIGVAIRVYRETSSDRIVEWADGAFIKASQMTLENLQQLHLIEEAQDYPILNSLSKYPDGVHFNALGSRVINVNDPKDPQDAVTKNYMENVQGGFVASNTKILNEAKATLSATQQTQSKAQTNETLSKAWATATESPDSAEDAQSSTGKTQSSRSWALYSKGKAQEAATSEAHAKTSETNAKVSETKSLASEQNAKDSETNAKTSEIKAATSEVNAKTSETNAKSSETKSKDSENAARVSEQNAAESARVAVENAMDFNMLKRNKAYAIGDIAYSSYLPSWARLECVTAGTTADTIPSPLLMSYQFLDTNKEGFSLKAGQYITDGTAIFILDDVRDGNRVGDIVLKPTLNDGYIKANGAVVKASEYPRLLKFAQDNNLCVSDSEWNDNSATKYVYDESEDSLKVPNVVGRVLQGGDELITKSAGLLNIKGTVTFRTIAIKDNNLILNDNFPLTGAFYKTTKIWSGSHAALSVSDQSPYVMEQLNIDASRSNSVYGNSDTVQPPACCLIAQIKY